MYLLSFFAVALWGSPSAIYTLLLSFHKSGNVERGLYEAAL